jgi:hypothetical protein
MRKDERRRSPVVKMKEKDLSDIWKHSGECETKLP